MVTQVADGLVEDAGVGAVGDARHAVVDRRPERPLPAGVVRDALVKLAHVIVDRSS
jgi:hypothetical protein